jgi:predicted DNA-binding transcriptional regulator AlpA
VTHRFSEANTDMMTSQMVAASLQVSTRTLWRLVAAGQFPQPVRYNRKLVRWRRADVAEYFRQLVAQCAPPIELPESCVVEEDGVAIDLPESCVIEGEAAA